MKGDRRLFVRRLAEHLAGHQALKSVALEVEARAASSPLRPAWEREWAGLRSASPLFGYPTVDEAERELTEFLGLTTTPDITPLDLSTARLNDEDAP